MSEMAFNQLFVWVEGPDDQRFVDTIFRVELERSFNYVQVIPYAGMKKEKITRFIQSIRAIPNANYIFLVDKNDSPCVAAKKEKLTRAIRSLEADRILVVVREIESWYLAGLTTDGHSQFGIAELTGTDQVDKEQFDRLRSMDFQSRIDWMIEMLRYYSLQQATSRNSSLRYFVSKFLSPEPIKDSQI